MGAYEYEERWGGNLPHLHPPNATLFVTFRLAGSVPKHILRLWLAEKNWLQEEETRLKRLLLTEAAPELQQHEERLQAFQRKWFQKFEEVLHAAAAGARWLAEEEIAKLDQFSIQCTGRIGTATGRERGLGNCDDRTPYRSRY